MNVSCFNTNILTHTAIAALKNAYEECSDKAAKESIITAFKAINQLHYCLGKQNRTSENGSIHDPGGCCSAA